ncbi:hypothetical protein M3090_03220 [Bacteroides sp. ET71]|uniref:hypothetical protein n=1 Tax=Bacteroides sp. ET71 TaxID=2939421 RepID=UPI0020117349|nr:hypothetical protein [Bacteroides sp. ET71]MCL1615411.1 hypothetical protein [Bacteroides sp. ET71]
MLETKRINAPADRSARRRRPARTPDGAATRNDGTHTRPARTQQRPGSGSGTKKRGCTTRMHPLQQFMKKGEI